MKGTGEGGHLNCPSSYPDTTIILLKPQRLRLIPLGGPTAEIDEAEPPPFREATGAGDRFGGGDSIV